MAKHFAKVSDSCAAKDAARSGGELSEPWVIYNDSKSSDAKFRVLYKVDGSLNNNNSFYGSGSENEFHGCE
jgi:hypothetical protein